MIVRRTEQVDAVAATLEALPENLPSLIRVEGLASVGKTPFAQTLASELKRQILSSDDFIRNSDQPDRPYKDCLRLSDMQRTVRETISKSEIVFEGICSQDILSLAEFGRGLVIYIKRLSYNNPDDPIWHDGLWLEGAEPSNELHRSLHMYHHNFKPHQMADIVLELPDMGHGLNGPICD